MNKPISRTKNSQLLKNIYHSIKRLNRTSHGFLVLKIHKIDNFPFLYNLENTKEKDIYAILRLEKYFKEIKISPKYENEDYEWNINAKIPIYNFQNSQILKLEFYNRKKFSNDQMIGELEIDLKTIPINFEIKKKEFKIKILNNHFSKENKESKIINNNNIENKKEENNILKKTRIRSKSLTLEKKKKKKNVLTKLNPLKLFKKYKTHNKTEKPTNRKSFPNFQKPKKSSNEEKNKKKETEDSESFESQISNITADNFLKRNKENFLTNKKDSQKLKIISNNEKLSDNEKFFESDSDFNLVDSFNLNNQQKNKKLEKEKNDKESKSEGRDSFILVHQTDGESSKNFSEILDKDNSVNNNNNNNLLVENFLSENDFNEKKEFSIIISLKIQINLISLFIYYLIMMEKIEENEKLENFIDSFISDNSKEIKENENERIFIFEEYEEKLNEISIISFPFILKIFKFLNEIFYWKNKFFSFFFLIFFILCLNFLKEINFLILFSIFNFLIYNLYLNYFSFCLNDKNNEKNIFKNYPNFNFLISEIKNKYLNKFLERINSSKFIKKIKENINNNNNKISIIKNLENNNNNNKINDENKLIRNIFLGRDSELEEQKYNQSQSQLLNERDEEKESNSYSKFSSKKQIF